MIRSEFVANNYARLIELLNKSKGNRSLNKFAEDCGIDAGHLSRIMRGIMINPPTPDTLKKIADKAHNKVTYEELMIAAGHLQKKFVGSNLALLRGNKTYEEFSLFLKEKINISLSPWLLERYEKEIEYPDDVIIEYLSNAEDFKNKYAAKPKEEENVENWVNAPEYTGISTPPMSKEIEEWLAQPENYPYIEFIYNAYKAGITKELLTKAEISIRIK